MVGWDQGLDVKVPGLFQGMSLITSQFNPSPRLSNNAVFYCCSTDISKRTTADIRKLKVTKGQTEVMCCAQEDSPLSNLQSLYVKPKAKWSQ